MMASSTMFIKSYTDHQNQTSFECCSQHQSADDDCFTNNSKDDIELLKYLKILGPPAYKFFDRDGIELKGFSIQGYMDAEKFIEHLNQIKDID